MIESAAWLPDGAMDRWIDGIYGWIEAMLQAEYHYTVDADRQTDRQTDRQVV
jgi:hypothetical protein